MYDVKGEALSDLLKKSGVYCKGHWIDLFAIRSDQILEHHSGDYCKIIISNIQVRFE